MYIEFKQNNIDSKLSLHYLEFHLTEHCNMNCKGCGHFSCIAEPEFADIIQHFKDMKRLSELVDFRCIRLLGGEPLLHPDVVEFMRTTRAFFPKSYISIVTNGILLPAMPKEFWHAVVSFNIAVDVTLYKPMWKKKDEILELLKSHNVSGEFKEVSSFLAKADMKGCQDYLDSFHNCPFRECRFLQAGKIATCAYPFIKRHVNNKFGLIIDEEDDGTIDIHDPELDSLKLMKLLNTPFKLCRYCVKGERRFEWDFTKNDLSEWEFTDKLTSSV